MTDPEFEKFIAETERSVWEAVVRKDGQALADLFDDDYIEITLKGRRVEKSLVVAESPEVDEIDSYEMRNAQVIRISEDCAVISYHVTIDGTCDGRLIDPADRWATSIWRFRGGAWKCCLFQQSPFADD